MMSSIRAFLSLAAVALLAVGCASNSGPQAKTAVVRAQGRGALSAAIGMLYEGRADEARKVLVKALEVHPNDRRAKSLLQQIDENPQTLLGEENFIYRVRSGDTLSSVAQQFLGDPTLFYALARYNDMSLPVTLAPGSNLRVPGRRKTSAPPLPRVTPQARPSVRTAPRAQAGVHSSNPQRAARLRVAGLEQLNRGNIDQAVTLLEQASQSDPNDGLAKRDLERALRIQRTVSARP
jgi:hypothetical protein